MVRMRWARLAELCRSFSEMQRVGAASSSCSKNRQISPAQRRGAYSSGEKYVRAISRRDAASGEISSPTAAGEMENYIFSSWGKMPEKKAGAI